MILLIIKDIKLLFEGKLHIVLVISIIVYTLYINLFYVNTDIESFEVYIPNKIEVEDIEEDIIVKLTENSDAIGLYNINGQYYSIITENTSLKNYNLKKLYINDYIKQMDFNDSRIDVLGSKTFKETKVLEMLSVIVFFEITTVTFLSIAALFFKEKNLGVLKVHGILPIKNKYILLSKMIVFIGFELIFVMIIGIMNLGFRQSFTSLPKISIEVILLSSIMVLLAFIFVVLFKDFKDFVFAYLILIIGMTSPVFLIVNTPFKWSGIKYFFTYYLYISIRNVYLQEYSTSMTFYVIFLITIFLLFIICLSLFNKLYEDS